MSDKFNNAPTKKDTTILSKVEALLGILRPIKNGDGTA